MQYNYSCTSRENCSKSSKGTSRILQIFGMNGSCNMYIHLLCLLISQHIKVVNSYPSSCIVQFSEFNNIEIMKLTSC